MNNALRITLIVFVLLIIVVIAGNMIEKFYNGKIIDFQKKMSDFDKKIADIDNVIAQNEQQKVLLKEIKQEAKKYDKYVLTYDSPPVTFDYLLDITYKIDKNLQYNFNHSGQERKGEYIENSYLLKGTAGLQKFYKFINHIEKQRPLYYIHNLAVSAPEMTVSDTVTYSFMITSISRKIEPEKVDIDLKKITSDRKVRGLFVCDLIINNNIAEEKRTLRNKELFNPEGSTLIAVTGNEAFFKDTKGIFQVLKKGDLIYDGVLTEIDHIKGIVTFTLTKDGVKYEKEYSLKTRGN